MPSDRPKRQQNVDQLLELQRDTLAAVNSLVAIQGEIQEIKGGNIGTAEGNGGAEESRNDWQGVVEGREWDLGLPVGR